MQVHIISFFTMVPAGGCGSGEGVRLTAPPTWRQDTGEIYDFVNTHIIIGKYTLYHPRWNNVGGGWLFFTSYPYPALLAYLIAIVDPNRSDKNNTCLIRGPKPIKFDTMCDLPIKLYRIYNMTVGT